MRFTVIGHSCLYVETSAGTILVDPWLIGSCYWRSWWHFPPSAELRDEWFSPDYVYLTHHHFDHFHYPSMRKINKRAHVLVPEFGVDVMVPEVRSLGFDNVSELAHADVVRLGGSTQVASYQYGFDDTTFVIADGADVLVDINDCKIRGRALRQIVETFGRPTFAMKSYSFSQSYPLGYQADDSADLALVTRDTYVRDFVGRMEAFAKYAVPFGSMVAFLHPETRDLNKHFVPPGEVVDAFDVRTNRRTQAVEMAPGDGWDSDSGLRVAGVDWYTDREKHIDELAHNHERELSEQAELELGRTVAWDVFEPYFESFVRSVPSAISRHVITRPIVFDVPSSADARYWVIDMAGRSVYRTNEPPASAANIVYVPEAVMADAIDKRIVHFVHGSMRIRTDLRAGGLSSDLAFWGLMMIWELGYLDRGALKPARVARVFWRRRSEFFDAARRALGGRGAFIDRMADRFTES